MRGRPSTPTAPSWSHGAGEALGDLALLRYPDALLGHLHPPPGEIDQGDEADEQPPLDDDGEGVEEETHPLGRVEPARKQRNADENRGHHPGGDAGDGLPVISEALPEGEHGLCGLIVRHARNPPWKYSRQKNE